MSKEHRILIDYTNHAKIRAVREIVPHQLSFDRSYWHLGEQWLLDAYDVAKDDMRTFAVKDIHRWGVEPGRQMEIDLSLAAQLQRSMELNARMKNRLAKLVEYLEDNDRRQFRAATHVQSILKDEEPTWPQA